MEQIKTQAQVFYAYTIGNARIKSMSTSNVDSVELRDVTLYCKKYANQNYFKPGDTLSYTILLTNQGNYKATNIVINDDIFSQTVLSETINVFSLKSQESVEFSYHSKDNSFIVEIKELNPLDTIALTYQTISNLSDVPYNINTNAIIYSDEVNPLVTNHVLLETKFADVIISKKCVTDYTYFNTDISYLITLENTGNIDAEEIEIVDQIPTTFELDKDTPIMINGSPLNTFTVDSDKRQISIQIAKVKAHKKYEIIIKGKIIK